MYGIFPRHVEPDARAKGTKIVCARRRRGGSPPIPIISVLALVAFLIVSVPGVRALQRADKGRDDAYTFSTEVLGMNGGPAFGGMPPPNMMMGPPRGAPNVMMGGAAPPAWGGAPPPRGFPPQPFGAPPQPFGAPPAPAPAGGDDEGRSRRRRRSRSRSRSRSRDRKRRSRRE